MKWQWLLVSDPKKEVTSKTKVAGGIRPEKLGQPSDLLPVRKLLTVLTALMSCATALNP